MPFNFPAPLPARFQDGLSYPLNLTADNRNYFTRMRFIKYQPAYGKDAVNAVGGLLAGQYGALLGGATGAALGAAVGGPVSLITGVFGLRAGVAVAGGAGEILVNQGTGIGNIINLPIPKKINEMNMMNWSEITLTGTLLDAARSIASNLGGRTGAAAAGTLSSVLQIGSSFAGVQLNPFLLQYFQRPSFREFSFTWTLAPRNKKESEQIHKIINQIKARQAPRLAAGGFLMEYPDLAIVEFHPQDEFQIRLKECVIVGVNVDYTPAGPSYIGGTAAPTMVNLTIHLKETKLWFSDEWGGTAVGNIPDDFRAPPPGIQPDGIDPLFGPGGLSN